MVWCDVAQDNKICLKTRWLKLCHKRIIVFSISASTKIKHPATPTIESVILPEMANAVICP
jgi:hypothetical protein